MESVALRKAAGAQVIAGQDGRIVNAGVFSDGGLAVPFLYVRHQGVDTGAGYG